MNLKALADPFPASDIEWRVQSAGEKSSKVWARVLAYITNRAIMQRLDDVCGPENWRNEYRYEQGGAVLCGISIFVSVPNKEAEWVTKWDGAENTDIEAVKGGLSNAMKRAAVQWGIGRYLYELEEGFANVNENGANYQAKKDGKYPAFKWDPPALPAWALPGGSGKVTTSARPTASTETAPAAQYTSKSDEDRQFRGKRLGNYESTELRGFINEPNAPASLKASCRAVLADRSLGNTDDAKVERAKAAVAADDAELPF